MKCNLEEEGPAGFVADVGDYLWSYATYPFLHKRNQDERLEIFGRSIPYFRHHDNRAWRNERSVELALAVDILDNTKPGQTLEVGNVMSHYGYDGQDILDKYEESPGVIIEDIVDFGPEESYERGLCISTPEHARRDERPREADKISGSRSTRPRWREPGSTTPTATPTLCSSCPPRAAGPTTDERQAAERSSTAPTAPRSPAGARSALRGSRTPAAARTARGGSAGSGIGP